MITLIILRGAVFCFSILYFHTGDSDSNIIKGNTANDNEVDGIFLDLNSNENDVLFNSAFDNGMFDIEHQAANNFKGNKCDMSDPAGICN